MDRQRDACLNLARDRGWTVAGEYVDNDTSASGDKARPEYSRLVVDAQAGRFDVVVTWQVDRLTRKLTDLEALIELCERTGVRIATVAGDVDLSTDAGRLVGRILASVARGEVERKATRQIAAAAQRAADGKPSPARRAFGYTGDGLKLHRTESRLLKALYARAVEQLNGNPPQVNVSALASWLNAQGSRTPQGQPWKRTGVRSVLLNPRNAGLRSYSTVVQGRRRSRIVRDAVWPAAVDRDVWEVVTAALRAPERRLNRSGVPKWLLTDLALCGRCGDGTRVLTTYREGGRRIYRCKAAPHLSRAAGPVDDYVRRVVIERLSRPDAIDMLTPPSQVEDAAAAREEMATLRQRRSALATGFAMGDVPYDLLVTSAAQLDQLISAASARLVSATRSPALDGIIGSDDVAAAFDASPLGARRAVLDAVCTITLLPAGTGRRAFDPATVVVDWR